MSIYGSHTAFLTNYMNLTILDESRDSQTRFDTTQSAHQKRMDACETKGWRVFLYGRSNRVDWMCVNRPSDLRLCFRMYEKRDFLFSQYLNMIQGVATQICLRADAVRHVQLRENSYMVQCVY